MEQRRYSLAQVTSGDQCEYPIGAMVIKEATSPLPVYLELFFGFSRGLHVGVTMLEAGRGYVEQHSLLKH